MLQAHEAFNKQVGEKPEAQADLLRAAKLSPNEVRQALRELEMTAPHDDALWLRFFFACSTRSVTLAAIAAAGCENLDQTLRGLFKSEVTASTPQGTLALSEVGDTLKKTPRAERHQVVQRKSESPSERSRSQRFAQN